MKKKILVVCTGNSCRSKIAESHLRHFAGDKAEVYSAGIERQGVNPQAVAIRVPEIFLNSLNDYQRTKYDYTIYSSKKCIQMIEPLFTSG